MSGADTAGGDRFVQRDGLGWLEPAVALLPGVKIAVTTRAGGVSEGARAGLNLATHVGDEPALVEENRRRLRQTLGLPSEPCWLQQVHGTVVAEVDAHGVAQGAPGCVSPGVDPLVAGKASVQTAAWVPPVADAAITRGEQVLAILTADCLPVVFALPRRGAGSQDGPLLGAAHAGWRGLLGGVLEATLAKLEAAGGDLAGAVAWLGPAIGPTAFEVGDEVRAAFVAASPLAATAFLPNANGRWQADLFLLARQRLAQAGVRVVGGGGVCTHSDSACWYSYRRDARPGLDTGRLATLVWQERVTL
jgi:YfiH family protein